MNKLIFFAVLWLGISLYCQADFLNLPVIPPVGATGASGATGPSVSAYTPNAPSRWASPAPTTVQAALDRISAVVGASPTPIP